MNVVSTFLLILAFAGLPAQCLIADERPSGSFPKVTPPEIWDGYDPRKEPLEEEVLKTWEKDGIRYKEVYFNGEKYDGKYVRIYGIYAAPTGAKNLPALLHIHGGGQTTNQDWLREFAGRGYAALTINWGGKWPNRKMVTQWNEVPNGNHKERTGTRITEPSPRSDAYYLWTQASMRAVSYLESQPEVDPDKIGAFGISMGGGIMWNLAFDPRIKAGCAIYGAGWNTYGADDPKYVIGHQGYTPSENDVRWRASLAPEASAPHVGFPMLFLSSSNDRHGVMDRAEDSLALIPEGVPRAWALTPRFRHHIGADFIHDLPNWMDVHLKGEGVWPQAPECEVKLGEHGVPVFLLKPDRVRDVVKVEIFYALENPYSVNRHWRDGRVTASDGVFSAPLPVMNADEYLFSYANITYESGTVISSPLEAVIPAELGAVATIAEPSRVFYEGAEGLAGWTSNSTGTDPIPAKAGTRMKVAVGPEGKSGFTVERVSPLIYAPGDPEYRAPEGASLQFDIKTAKGEDFVVKLHKHYWVAGFSTFACEVAVGANSGWQTITIDGGQFLNVKNDEPLGSSINEANVLELSMKNGWKDEAVIFRNFRWSGGEYVPHVHAYRGESIARAGVTNSDDADHLQDHEAVEVDSLIQGSHFDSTRRYRVVPGGFRKGSRLWTDRKYEVQVAPKELVGGTLIQTPMEDRSNPSDQLVSFTALEKCAVHVLMKVSPSYPGWVSSWEKSDLRVQATNQMGCFRKTLPAGETIVLGSARGLSAMYSVVVTKQP